MSATPGFSQPLSPLPHVLTPLLGRVRESADVQALVRDPAQRLVTLTGPGGVGKTRLALHVGSRLQDAFDDVVYVPLASILDPHLVLPSIGQALGMFTDVQDGYEDRLVEALQGQPLLLVLDNMEQVLDAAPALAHVLARCPEISILVTSRAPLGIVGEQQYPLDPLPIPDVGQTSTADIVRSDAVALFVQRARAVNPRLEVSDQTAQTIAEVCRRLDGLPLAIELAAARTNILSPDALLARLTNRLQVLGSERHGVPDRLRTMRHAIAWSYDLLTPAEQALFRRMSVFSGGVSLEAVEAIFEPGAENRDALDVLGTLVNHSLVKSTPRQPGEARFLMLETLRDYGQEQLELLGLADEARLVHAEYFADLAERAEPLLKGNEQEEWFNRLDPESENIRAAVDWSIDHGHPEIVLRVGGAIWQYCANRGLATDCGTWLERGLAAGTERSPYRIKALIGVGNLFEIVGNLDGAWSRFEQARDLAVSFGDPLNECLAVTGLGIVAHDRGDYAEALALHTQAATLARAADDPRSTAVAVANMAGLSYLRGNLDDAERFWEESLEIFRSLGDATAAGVSSSNLGVLALGRGDLERAERWQRQALELQRRMKLVRDLPYTLTNLGEVLGLLGDYTQAYDCFAEAIAFFHEEGNAAMEGAALNSLATLALAQGDIDRAASTVLDSIRLVMDGEYPTCNIENAEVLASICVARGMHAAAAELLAAAARHRQDLGNNPTPRKSAENGEVESAARRALGAEAFATAWARGGRLDFAAMSRRVSIVAGEIVGKRQAYLEAGADARSDDRDGVIPADHGLTGREIEVLRLLAQGHSTRAIADALFISPRTAGTHITNILGKLGVPSRTAAVAYAMRSGIV